MRGDYSNFGSTIKNLREERSLTQRELANRVGVHPIFLSDLERGIRVPPSEGTILRMASVLLANSDELIRLAGKVPSDLEAALTDRPHLLAALRHMAHSPDAARSDLDACPMCLEVEICRRTGKAVMDENETSNMLNGEVAGVPEGKGTPVVNEIAKSAIGTVFYQEIATSE